MDKDSRLAKMITIATALVVLLVGVALIAAV
jgi:hypothetical protein